MATEVDAQATLLDGELAPAGDLRRELLGGLFPAPGIVSGLQASALPTPAMMVRLPSGLCMVDDQAGGFIPLYLLAQVDLDIGASDPSLPRYDSVIAEAVDTGDPGTLIRRFRVVSGTPAASPTAPALPYSDEPTGLTERIANVYVQANAESNGYVRSQDVTVVAAATSPVPGPAQALQAGSTTVSFTSQTSFSKAITFPTAFSTAPKVAVNIESAPAETAGWSARATAITPTGFNLFVFATGGAAVSWSAVPVGWMATTP